MNYLNEENLKTIYPNSSNFSLNDLSKEEKYNYLALYNMYRMLFTEFMIEKLNLKQYDQEIVNSDLNFQIQDEANMDIYQYFSSDILKYFYIRNNVYVERLTKSEQEFFEKKINNNDNVLDDESKEMIEKTFKKVIFEDVMKNGKTCETFYGPDSNSFLSPNNAIVIGMRYDEFKTNGLSDSEWDRLHDKQLFYLYPLLDKMNFELINNLDTPISILKYNEFSIITKEIGIDNEEEEMDR